MKTLLLLIVSTWFVAACSSPAVNNVAKTNVNAVNSVPYSRTENAYTFAQNSDLARDLTPSGTKEAREIVGKTVSESKLWQNNKFVKRLRKLMGADYQTMKKFWNTETPIKKFGDFLMMTGCEQDNCAYNRYVMFMDLGDGCINVIHFGKDATKAWNDYEEIALPPPFAEELDAMKSNGKS
ncbi:MAG TPA: hypothetical protein PLL77_09075 [Pyrinomonadaceae bacterium]|nr:hypothetical protein [Pyrinomonadaceae bacterium]